MSSPIPGEVSRELKKLKAIKRKTVSYFKEDYERLRNICGVPYRQVIRKVNSTDPVFFVVDRELAMKMLKDKFAFHTEKEASAKILDAMKQEKLDGS